MVLDGFCWAELASLATEECTRFGYILLQGKCYAPVLELPRKTVPTSKPREGPLSHRVTQGYQAAPQAMTGHYPRVRLSASHGAPMIREGITICFYMRRSHREIARAVKQSLDVYLSAVGPRTLAWYAGQDDWQMLDATSWNQLRHNLREHDWPSLELKDDPDGVHGFGVEYYGKWFEDPRGLEEPDMVSALGFWLPTEFLEARGPAAVRELALELAAPLPFCSGHAGLSFHAMHGYQETEEQLSESLSPRTSGGGGSGAS